MRKRVIRALIFIAVALGIALGAAGAAGAIGFPGADGGSTDGMTWGLGGVVATTEHAAA